MAKVAGWEATVVINSIQYRCKRWEVDDTVADLECGDSEDGQYEARIDGRHVANITIEQAAYDPVNNPFAIAPGVNLSSGQLCEIQIYPAGIGQDFHDFPVVQINSAKQAGEVGGLSPVTVTGKTSGSYTMATT